MEALFWGDILVTIFHFLNNTTLYSAKLVNSQWNNIIAKYHDTLFVPTWVETYNLLQQFPTDTTNSSFVCYNSTFNGMKYNVELNGSYLSLYLCSTLGKTDIKIIKWKVDWYKCRLLSIRSFKIPSVFDKGGISRHFVLMDVFDTTWLLLSVMVIDITNLENILLYDLGKIDPTRVNILPFLPNIKKSSKITVVYSLPYDNLFYFNENLYHWNENGSRHKIRQIINMNASLRSDGRNIVCHHYLLKYEKDVITFINLFQEQIQASIYQRNTYICHFIELSLHHIIILLGQTDDNGRKVQKFYYLLVDLKRFVCSRFRRCEDTSFLYFSKVEMRSKNIVHVYSENNEIVKINLNSLCLIE